MVYLISLERAREDGTQMLHDLGRKKKRIVLKVELCGLTSVNIFKCSC